MKTQLDRIEEELKKLNHMVTGNGTPERGIIVRLDRIEQNEKTRNKYVGAAIVAAIGAAVTTAWSKIVGS